MVAATMEARSVCPQCGEDVYRTLSFLQDYDIQHANTCSVCGGKIFKWINNTALRIKVIIAGEPIIRSLCIILCKKCSTTVLTVPRFSYREFCKEKSYDLDFELHVFGRVPCFCNEKHKSLLPS